MRRSAAVAGGAALTGLAGQAHAADEPAPGESSPLERAGGATIAPSDARYPGLTTGNNQRFVARPEYVKMIKSSGDAVRALSDAIKAGKRVSVRSGGHCFADFVCHPDAKVILDFSEMTAVGYDPSLRAFSVEPGARLLNVYEALYKGWGVTIPGGTCYSVGIGGHIAGGGYGLLSRRNGLVVDHLYAVEVVVASASGEVKVVRATREAGDPNRDLWWAHAGGGGGNFGLVTRYWFRSPGATGSTPGNQLIQPPSTVLVSAVGIPWSQLDQQGFTRLVKNYGAWFEANSAADNKNRHLSSIMNISSQANGVIGLFTQVDATVPGASQLLDEYLAAITAGVGATVKALDKPNGELPALPQLAAARQLPWLQATRLIATSNSTLNDPAVRGAHKSAYLRKNFTDTQVAALYAALTDPNYKNARTMAILFSYGGQVNAVAPDATAYAQRSSAFKLLFQTFWNDPAQDDTHLGWIRGMYGKFFAETGGVPGLNGQSDGCYINYPDSDMADPKINTSGVPWHALYYKDNYARLQQVKKRWDPADVFRHSLSVAPAK
ncbi:FAD-dependent oxidoreductase [Streptomyces sp. ISL-11]|uniref:FAD-dependent oxidoreductase n=1 Tax=Streptomyces sp. ISL-11 TaxID=2819174 RepID=UPI002034FA4E|nr:FAD-binding protein [Streptomyces sp. ISL-11]